MSLESLILYFCICFDFLYEELFYIFVGKLFIVVIVIKVNVF